MSLHCKITNTAADSTNTFTVYHISVYQLTGNNEQLLNKNTIKKRFSDFIHLKEQLEARFKCKIPYVFPELNGGSNQGGMFAAFKNVFSHSSLNKDVVAYRKTELEKFMNDMLGDQYDDKWRKCIITRIFFNHCYDNIKVEEEKVIGDMFDEGTKLSDIYITNSPTKHTNKDWWALYRQVDDVLKKMDDTEENKEHNLKELINVRLLLQRLESGIMDTDSILDRKKREKEFRNLKYKVSEKSNSLTKQHQSSEEDDAKKMLLFQQQTPEIVKKYDVITPTPGRKIGSRKQILEDQKEDLQSQEDTLASIRETVVRQKMISLAINDELLAQNELITSMEEDVNKSGAKIQKAHDRTERYNRG